MTELVFPARRRPATALEEQVLAVIRENQSLKTGEIADAVGEPIGAVAGAIVQLGLAGELVISEPSA